MVNRRSSLLVTLNLVTPLRFQKRCEIANEYKSSKINYAYLNGEENESRNGRNSTRSPRTNDPTPWTQQAARQHYVYTSSKKKLLRHICNRTTALNAKFINRYGSRFDPELSNIVIRMTQKPKQKYFYLPCTKVSFNFIGRPFFA